MPNYAYKQVLQNKLKGDKPKHQATTYYTVEGQKYLVPSWSHPAAVANRVLQTIQHSKFQGLQIIGPPGHGKTTVAKVIAHNIHKKDNRFNVQLVKAEAFKRLENTIRTMPKLPTIMIFDDLSGVFADLKDSEIEKNYKALTEVRWTLDPANGDIPYIPILTFHYSKTVEKKFRSQNTISIFCDFGNEEKTNMDVIAPRNTVARNVLQAFEYITNTMFTKHKFHLINSDGKFMKYETDKPFRPACMIHKNIGSVILYAENDVCEKCNVKHRKKQLPARELVQKVWHAYGLYGLQQLRQACADRGVFNAINPRAFVARQFIENKVFPQYDTDFEDIVKEVYSRFHKKPPKRMYRKRKEEEELMDQFDSAAEPPKETDLD